MSKYHVLFIAAVTVAAFGQVSLKKGAMGDRSFWKQYFNPYVGLGYLLLILSMGMALIAYREVPLKEGPILDSLGFVFVPVLSRVFFKERISSSRFLGFLLILVGIAVFTA